MSPLKKVTVPTWFENSYTFAVKVTEPPWSIWFGEDDNVTCGPGWCAERDSEKLSVNKVVPEYAA